MVRDASASAAPRSRVVCNGDSRAVTATLYRMPLLARKRRVFPVYHGSMPDALNGQIVPALGQWQGLLVIAAACLAAFVRKECHSRARRSAASSRSSS